MSSGEFGSTYDRRVEGVPVVLGVGTSPGGTPILTGISTPAAGFTYVLTGFDFFGASSIVGQVVGGLEWSGFGFWSATAALTTPSFESGGSWRGALPIGPLDSATMAVTVLGAPIECGCIAWGLVLPYVVPA